MTSTVDADVDAPDITIQTYEQALQRALERDPVDAANDAAHLHEITQKPNGRVLLRQLTWDMTASRWIKSVAGELARMSTADGQRLAKSLHAALEHHLQQVFKTCEKDKFPTHQEH